MQKIIKFKRMPFLSLEQSLWLTEKAAVFRRWVLNGLK